MRRTTTPAAGYRYAWDMTGSSGYREHRMLLEGTARYGPVHGFVFVNRNRLDVRDVAGDWSWRYRNRSRLERDLRLGSRVAMPYAMAEFFFDSRYDAWNRQRYSVGIEWPIGATSVLDTYYCRQDDSRASIAHVNAFGLALNLFFQQRHGLETHRLGRHRRFSMCLGSGFGIGAAGNVAFYKGFPQTTSISSVVASLIVTTKSQLLFNAKLDVSTANNKWVLRGDNRVYWTSQDTYGLGTSTTPD